MQRVVDRLRHDHAPETTPDASSGVQRPGDPWFVAQLDDAHGLVDLLRSKAIDVAGKRVADVASADGTLSLAVILAGAAQVLALDEERTDHDRLERLATLAGAVEFLPDHLEFRSIMDGGIPCSDDEFDLVVSGGAFTRLRWPTRVAGEIHRCLRPDGVLLLKANPLFDSSVGGLLPNELGPFSHLLLQPDVLESRVRQLVSDEEHASGILDRFHRLNRLSLDELQQVLLLGGFDVVWAHVDAPPVELPLELQHHPLSNLAPASVTLLARPRR